MKFGCCLNMNARDTEGIGLGDIELAAQARADYVELPLAQLMALDAAAFRHACRIVRDAGIPCEACNNFIPASVRITGPSVQEARVRDYVSEAVERASSLGAKVVVFGSSGAKNVPDGFPEETAWQQIADFLAMADGFLAGTDIRIAIEPICHRESNILYTVREGQRMAEQVNRPRIGVLADFFHMSQEKEDPALSLVMAGKRLIHTHIALHRERLFPVCGEEAQLLPFFDALNGSGYEGRMSLEAYAPNLGSALVPALQTLRRCAAETGM